MRLLNSIADWEDLPPELLAVIAKRLTSSLDYTSFRGVCKSWKYAATFDNFDHVSPQVPWLMFIEGKKERQKGSRPMYMYTTKFLDLSNNKKMFRIAKFLKEDEDSINYYLSCCGWLLGVAKSSVHIYLTHPIWHIRIKLPDLDSFPGYTNCHINSSQFIEKMVLSGSPKIVSDLVIMVIWGKKKQLAFSRPGDSSWALIERWDRSFTDILYHNEKLYAIDDKLRVVECDIRGPNPTRLQKILSIPDLYTCGYCYMVESSGKFLIVSVYCYLRYLFRVFEFDLMDGSYKEIDDLGNRTLFLGECSSSLCLEDFTWNDEVKPNCIYLADNGECFHVGKENSKDFLGPDIQQNSKDFLGPDLLTGVYIRTWVVPGF